MAVGKVNIIAGVKVDNPEFPLAIIDSQLVGNGSISNITVDNGSLFMGINNGQSNFVVKMNKSPLTILSSTNVHTNPIHAVTHINGYVYYSAVANSGSATLYKLDSTDFSLVAQYANKGGKGMAFDGEYAYTCSNNTLRKINLSDGAIVANRNVGTIIEALYYDGEHLYASGSGNITYKINTDTLSIVAEVPRGSSNIISDREYLYIRNQKIKKEDMSVVATNNGMGIPYVIENNFIYSVLGKVINQVDPENLDVKGSNFYLRNNSGLYSDNKHIYTIDTYTFSIIHKIINNYYTDRR